MRGQWSLLKDNKWTNLVFLKLFGSLYISLHINLKYHKLHLINWRTFIYNLLPLINLHLFFTRYIFKFLELIRKNVCNMLVRQNSLKNSTNKMQVNKIYLSLLFINFSGRNLSEEQTAVEFFRNSVWIYEAIWFLWSNLQELLEQTTASAIILWKNQKKSKGILLISCHPYNF